MATCGHCKAPNQSIDHVRECSAAHFTMVSSPAQPSAFVEKFLESADYRPMALSNVIPASKYALEMTGSVRFYEVQDGKGKWDGYQFVSQLIGHPGDWKKIPVKGTARTQVLFLIRKDALGAAQRFSKEFVVCAVCSSPLSTPESLALGMGPICREKF